MHFFSCEITHTICMVCTSMCRIVNFYCMCIVVGFHVIKKVQKDFLFNNTMFMKNYGKENKKKKKKKKTTKKGEKTNKNTIHADLFNNATKPYKISIRRPPWELTGKTLNFHSFHRQTDLNTHLLSSIGFSFHFFLSFFLSSSNEHITQYCMYGMRHWLL